VASADIAEILVVFKLVLKCSQRFSVSPDRSTQKYIKSSEEFNMLSVITGTF
jgi:hypothetical protein